MIVSCRLVVMLKGCHNESCEGGAARCKRNGSWQNQGTVWCKSYHPVTVKKAVAEPSSARDCFYHKVAVVWRYSRFSSNRLNGFFWKNESLSSQSPIDKGEKKKSGRHRKCHRVVWEVFASMPPVLTLFGQSNHSSASARLFFCWSFLLLSWVIQRLRIFCYFPTSNEKIGEKKMLGTGSVTYVYSNTFVRFESQFWNSDRATVLMQEFSHRFGLTNLENHFNSTTSQYLVGFHEATDRCSNIRIRRKPPSSSFVIIFSLWITRLTLNFTNVFYGMDGTGQDGRRGGRRQQYTGAMGLSEMQCCVHLFLRRHEYGVCGSTHLQVERERAGG